MPMRSYTAVTSVIGPLRTGAVHAFHFTVSGRPVEARLRSLIRYVDGGWLHEGLRALFFLEAPSLARAAPAFEAAADAVFDAAALAAAAEVPMMHVDLVIEHDLRDNVTSIYRFRRDPLPPIQLRKVYWSHSQALWAWITTNPDAAPRALRALRWYRRALTETDPIDRFDALYTSLEALNPLLQRHWGIESEVRRCGHCKKELGKRHGTYGIDRLLESMDEGDAELPKAVRHVRNAIVHAFTPIDEIAGETEPLIPVLEAAVPRGFAKLMELEGDAETSLARPPLPTARTHDSFACARVRGHPDALGLAGRLPHLDYVLHANHHFDAEGAVSEISLEAAVQLMVPPSAELLELAVIGHRVDGVGISATVTSLEHEELAPYPNERGKGVTLFEQPTEQGWRPQVPHGEQSPAG